MNPTLNQLQLPPDIDEIFGDAYVIAERNGLVREVNLAQRSMEYALVDTRVLREKLDQDSIEVIRGMDFMLGVFLDKIKKCFVFADKVPPTFHEAMGIHECGEMIAGENYPQGDNKQRHGYACRYDLEHVLQEGEDLSGKYGEFMLKHPGYFRAIPCFLRIARKKGLSPQEIVKLYEEQVDGAMYSKQLKERLFTLLKEGERFGVFSPDGNRVVSIAKHRNSVFDIYQDLLEQRFYEDAKNLRKVLKRVMPNIECGQKRDPTQGYILGYISNLIKESNGNYTRAEEAIRAFRLGREKSDLFHSAWENLIKEENFEQAKQMERKLGRFLKYGPWFLHEKLRHYVYRIFDYQRHEDGKETYLPNVCSLQLLEKARACYPDQVKKVLNSEAFFLIREMKKSNTYNGKPILWINLSRKEFLRRLGGLFG